LGSNQKPAKNLDCLNELPWQLGNCLSSCSQKPLSIRDTGKQSPHSIKAHFLKFTTMVIFFHIYISTAYRYIMFLFRLTHFFFFFFAALGFKSRSRSC
jgi:hypothetical protein